MKKIVAFVFIILIVFTSFSQGTRPSFGIGGKGGVNISYFADNFSVGQSAIGANVGAVGIMNFGANGTTSFVAEILFSRKGGANRASGKNEISAIDIPILFRFSKSIKEEIPLKLFFNAGPYIGVNFSRKVTGELPLNYAKDFSTNFLELGLCAGVGVSYPIGPGALFLEGRYAFSITNVVPKSLENNRITSITLGYVYYLQGQTEEQKDKKIDSGFE